MHPPAIVLDGAQRSALATVRSLGRRGIPVIVAEAHAGSLAAASRFCTSTLTYPDPSREQAAFLSWLRSLNDTHAGAVLMPMTDLTVPLVLHAQKELSNLRVALPSGASYHAASDKLELFRLATRVGVRAPETRAVTRPTIAELHDVEFHYPVVMKPRVSVLRRPDGVVKRSVSYARDRAELFERLDRQVIDENDEWLLQECITGYGAGVFALYDRGQPLCFFAHRRIREKPPSGGVSVVCESVELAPERVDAVRRLLDPLDWHGVAMVEFKVDDAGRAWLIEVNARFWGSLQLAVDAGADFPARLYSLAVGEPQPAAEPYAVGRRLRWWLGDLDNLYAQLRSSRFTPGLAAKARAIAQFMVPWQPGLRYEFLRGSDPQPALHALRTYLRDLTRSRR